MSTSPHHCSLDLTAEVPARAGDRGAVGRFGEDLAARHLVTGHHLRILARNWRVSLGELRGELDIVAVDEPRGCVVVCEVKTRREATRFGGAMSAVSPRQRAKIRSLTAAFLRDAALPFHWVRLDMVAVDLGRRSTLTHLQDAW